MDIRTSETNQITTIQPSHPVMSSREISILADKKHHHVCRDIRVILSEVYNLQDEACRRNPNLVYETNQHVSCVHYDKKNPNAWEYLMSRRFTEILITGYDVKRRAAVIDRWYELESGQAQSLVIPQSLPEALRLAADLAEKNQGLIAQVNELEPKAEIFDTLVETQGAITLSEAAKTLRTGRTRLCSFLRSHKWLTRKNEPYQEKIEQGLLDVKLSNWEHPENGLQRTVTALVTAKGMIKLTKLLKQH